VNSEVLRVELNQNGTINLVVNVNGFDPGEPVEISGEVTQTQADGTVAVASFYSVKQMPSGNLPVRVEGVAAVPGNNFDPGSPSPITIVARAAQVWTTTLEKDPGSNPSVSGTTPPVAWIKAQAHWAVSWPGQDTPAVWGSQSAQPTPATTTA
jgi:hypothetical protein